MPAPLGDCRVPESRRRKIRLVSDALEDPAERSSGVPAVSDSPSTVIVDRAMPEKMTPDCEGELVLEASREEDDTDGNGDIREAED